MGKRKLAKQGSEILTYAVIKIRQTGKFIRKYLQI